LNQSASNNLRLNSYWMPFTANRSFKKNPRIVVSADRMHYTKADGGMLLDGTAGLWCVNAGHRRPKIVEAVQRQIEELDYSPAFQVGHPKIFELASRLVELMPGELNHVFFTNSGSESVDTALKIALAYHRVNGESSRFRLIGRERGYHGVNFGGISVGGLGANRKMYGPMLTGVDHIRHTHDLTRNAFSRGQPEHGVEFAEDLERLVQLHDPSTIAALIIEPMAGSAGVILPPKGYLPRIREICDHYGILLIFDEVITGFGRLGAPFATEYFGVIPDIVVTAKGLTNGVIPMGAVFVKNNIYDAFMTGPEHLIELFHGYTYSGNPVATAAAIGTLDTYLDEKLLTRAGEMSSYWEDAIHSLCDLPHVIDIRNMGLVGAIELEPRSGEPTKRAFEVYLKTYEKGVLVRTTGDIIALSPPLIIEKEHIDQIFSEIANALKEVK